MSGETIRFQLAYIYVSHYAHYTHYDVLTLPTLPTVLATPTTPTLLTTLTVLITTLYLLYLLHLLHLPWEDDIGAEKSHVKLANSNCKKNLKSVTQIYNLVNKARNFAETGVLHGC
jgi:hypothetical protein